MLKALRPTHFPTGLRPAARAAGSALSELRGLPVLLVSDEWDAAVLGPLLRAGARDYVTRPFRRDELAVRLERLVGWLPEGRA